MQKMLEIDLRKKSEGHRQKALALEGLQKTNGKFSRGDVIEFWGGYNNDIRYTAEISGTINDEIYLIWDCYWFPIRDENNRDIKLIKGAN